LRSQVVKLVFFQEIVEKEGVDVRKPDKDNITLLHWASINCRHDVVDFYMSKGAIVDAIGGDLNATPLHWAVRQGHQRYTFMLYFGRQLNYFLAWWRV
jgi:ankyrin repeat protein